MNYSNNPYMNNYMGQPMNYNNPYMAQPMQQARPVQPQPQVQPQQVPQYNTIVGLQGKSVDSIDVVKAMDIPLDFSVSYFPLTDGSAIITKQMQTDGTSKIVVYKPTEEKEPEKKIEYITNEQFDDAMKKVDNKDLKDDIKVMKRQIEDLMEDMKEVNKDLKKRKD